MEVVLGLTSMLFLPKAFFGKKIDVGLIVASTRRKKVSEGKILRRSTLTGSTVTFAGGWITADTFEQSLQRTFNTPFAEHTSVIFRFHPSCKVMVDAAVRLLSLANQLVAKGLHVSLVFDGESNDAMGYLNRANFFTCLSPQIRVMPERPDPTYAALYQGNSKNLVEFKSISPADYEASSSTPTQLIDALASATAARDDCKQLCHTAFTLFGELIDNIYSHSQTVLDGFAALQVYRNGGRVQVVVSDSGVGLLETLKPKLLTPSDNYLAEAELVSSLFRGDVLWDAGGRGAGLKRCAELALRHGSTVGVRLATCSIHLSPSKDGYQTANMRYVQDLPLLEGTHICFSFPLDFFT